MEKIECVDKYVVVERRGELKRLPVTNINYEYRTFTVWDHEYFTYVIYEFEESMKSYQIDYFYIQKAAAEVDRLQTKRILMERQLSN